MLLYLSLIDNDANRQFFEQIYINYKTQMYLMAQSILHNDTDSEDAVHEVFYNIASKHINTLVSIQNDTDLKNYLLKATKNTALNIIKKRSRTPLYLDALDDDNSSIPELSDNDFLDTVCATLEYNKLLNIISELPATYRDVLYYHFVLEFTAPEIADLFNTKTATIKKQLVRGKKLLLSKTNITGE